MTNSTSAGEFIQRIINLYRDFFEGIDLEKYKDKKLIQRIEFLENLDISKMDNEELEQFSKSILDARAIAVITEGTPNKFELGDREKMGGVNSIEFWFLKLEDSQVNNKLLEVLVHAWYKENEDYEIEDFEEENHDVEKEVDFRLTESQELIECKRISGDKEGATRNQLKETKKKLKYCKEEFPDHTGHLIIDLGSHTSELPSDYEEFLREDFKDEETREVKSFIENEIEKSEESYIDKVTVCWLGAYINENTWYSLHKTIEDAFSDKEISSYEGWTIRREKTIPGRSTIVISSDNKSIEHAKAGYDASAAGGQVFFSQQAAQDTKKE